MSSRSSHVRSSVIGLIAGLALCAGLLAVASVNASATAVRSAAALSGAASGRPGEAATPIVLSRTIPLTGGAVDMASTKSGTAYLGWITPVAGNDYDIKLCVLPLKATACKGGIQSVSSGESTGVSNNIKVIAAPDGSVTLVWYNSGASEIVESSVGSGGTLSAATGVASAPANGELLDAEIGPDGTIWTVSAGDSGNTIDVRDGIANAPITIHTPTEMGFARLAFAGKTGIIAMDDSGGAIVDYTYLSGGSWTKVKPVAHTLTANAQLGLVSTRSGVRLLASEQDHDLRPVIAKWTGRGFSDPKVADPAFVFNPDGHDFVADASGRAADVTYVNGKVTITNFADTTHGAIATYSAGGTTAGGFAQLTTNPRGEGWVAWATEGSLGTDGDVFRVAPVLLPGVPQHVAHKGAHGTATVTGPTSCMPAVRLAVSVKGHAQHGWKLHSHSLKLGTHKQGASLNGAALKPGRAYALKGTVVFAKGRSRDAVSATVMFRSCPAP